MNETKSGVCQAIIGSVKLTFLGPDLAATAIIDNSQNQSGKKVFRFVNAYSIATTQTDSEYSSLLKDGNVNFSDSTPCSWIATLILRTRVQPSRGPSVFLKTIKLAEDLGISCYFLGTSEEKLVALTRSVSEEFPMLKIAGMYSPPFVDRGEMPIEQICELVRESKAMLVFVSLGTPKQDFVASALTSTAKVTTVPVGAAFDFYIGSVKEAPMWIQNSGFEWLFRLAKEPKRLWKRYLLGNLRFLYLALLFSGKVK